MVSVVYLVAGVGSGITNYSRDGLAFVFSQCGCGLFSPWPPQPGGEFTPEKTQIRKRQKTDEPERDVADLETKQQLKNGKDELTWRSSCCTVCIWTRHCAAALSSRPCSWLRCLKREVRKKHRINCL